MIPVIRPPRGVCYRRFMPIALGRLSRRASSSEPAELLLECHDRIRQHMRGAIALSTASADDPAVPATAEAVHRYFSVALPLHSEDEDASVGPRLRATPLTGEAASAVAAMTAQHADIDLALLRLLPMWARLASEPASLSGLRETLVRDTMHFDALWAVHLDLEERIVFPLVTGRLDQATRAEIVREMRARRGTATA